MATGKRYYWIKLKESFMTSDTIDYFMEQPDGANYVVLYQLLCLKTINTGGRLSRQIGEITIPYDIAKIQRDCKWFSADTIRVALNLYLSVGLIYEDVDGTLVLTDHKNLVGSETDWAVKKSRQRSVPADNLSNGKALPCGDNVPTNVHENVTTDIDIRDREKRLEKELEIDSQIQDRESRGNGAAAPAPAGAATRHKHGAHGWVRLTEDEYARLIDDLGEEELTRCIDYIDESAQSTGNKNRWKDWNLVIRRCSRDRWGIRNGSGNGERRGFGRNAMDELQQLHQMYESWEGEQDG